MDAPGDDNPASPSLRGDGRPRLVGRVGSLDAFWPLIEPILESLQPRRLCEIGVDQGIFTDRLLAWTREQGGTYVGIDPAPDPAAVEKISPPGSLVLGRSLEVLPGLEPCDAYFIDGDHNYHTVRHELALIARATPAVGPVVFAHDVGWPWARRDMYHAPGTLPPEARHPAAADLGVSLESAELVAGGLRSPGRYAIAHRAGGERNGVLTAVEDFLRDDAGRDWRAVIVPMAYGLAILYRPAAVPEPCRAALERLDAACTTLGPFLESCEANFLSLYLYAEAAKAQADAYQELRGAYEELASVHRGLDDAYGALTSAYQDLSVHSEKLLEEYHRLRDAHSALERSSRREEGIP